MSDTVAVTEPVATATEPTQTTEAPVVEISPVEQIAREQGWVSKEEWVEGGGNAEEWRSAKEFVDRGELYKSLHSIKRELKQERFAREALQRHHTMVYEKAYEQAKADLRMEKRQAIREGDLERLEDVEDRIEKLDEQRAQEKAQLQAAPAPSSAGRQEAFDSFVSRNPWYTTNSELKDEADAIGFIYVNKGGDPEGLLTHVEKEMKRKFPEKLGVKRAAPNAVAPVSRNAPKGKGDDFELTDSEREVMNTFVRQGVMTKEQYIKDLKKVKERS